MIKIQTQLSDETEALVTRVIGHCIQVHRELGPGLLEDIYSTAVAIELEAGGIGFERESPLSVFYKGHRVGRHRLDFVVENSVLLELKSVETLAPVHHAQVMSYLRASKLRVGLLMNFNVPVLPQGLRRIVLEQPAAKAVAARGGGRLRRPV